ncbi:hypothetical protein BH10CYA1_BH10CYA1_13930 [soil metagenome]
MGEAHKIGDSPDSTSVADTHPGGAIDILEMWKQDRASTKGVFSAATASDSNNSGKKLEVSASNFAADISQGNYSDSEIAKKFTGFVKGLAGQDAMSLTLTLNEALREKGVAWHVRGSNPEGNEGTVGLYKNQPAYDDKVLVHSQFFKSGENIDADFNPSKAALSKIAAEFVRKNPDHLTSEALTSEVAKRIGEMKAAGAGPNDAEHAFNHALIESRQALRVSINTKGKVEVEQYHRNAAVAEVDLSKL